GYASADVEAAAERLLAAGYLGDEAFARGYVRRRSRALGPLAISAELAARGVNRDIADEALGGLSPDGQLISARRLARRLAGDARFASYRELLHAVGGKLLRRGFSMDVARAACQGVWQGTPEDSEA
ncbi:MAG TPA: regulatory protein RecX, partial [Candidatus Dormibacteraeota bacterium]|nr:regulatory protein RecX [Candidatus Dormibacteraeota bacterium]